MGKYFQHFDWITGLLLLCIGLLGLFLLLTLGTGIFYQQLFFIFLGFLLLLFFSNIEPLLLWWFAPIGYVLGNILLALSYLGPNIRGATRWIMIAGAQLQPSELAKPIFLLSFSYFMAKYSPRRLKYLSLHFVLFLIPFLLVFKQPDLGSSLVYASFWIGMMVAGGLPLSVIGLAMASGIFVLPYAWTHLLPYQKSRIETFINPALDPRGTGYNAIQAMIAVGSGQLFGRGLGLGTQSHLRFLPEHHTDFIFATLVEELGFAGGFLMFVLYAALLYRIIRPFITGKYHDMKVFAYSFGLFAFMFGQIFINTGMNIGLIPVTGITLPFISYGGSSILSLSIAFGILWALQRSKQTDTTIAIQ